MKNLRDSTLVFLTRAKGDTITDICLAMKKRGFGMGRWNGAGGKVEAGETIEAAAKREVREEIGVDLIDLRKIAELTFTFPHNPSWDQLVHVYFSGAWNGEPMESEEMRPQWFSVHNIPFREMWPDDEYWLPFCIEGKLLRASFSFGEGDTILEKEVIIVDSL